MEWHRPRRRILSSGLFLGQRKLRTTLKWLVRTGIFALPRTMQTRQISAAPSTGGLLLMTSTLRSFLLATSPLPILPLAPYAGCPPPHPPLPRLPPSTHPVSTSWDPFGRQAEEGVPIENDRLVQRGLRFGDAAQGLETDGAG